MERVEDSKQKRYERFLRQQYRVGLVIQQKLQDQAFIWCSMEWWWADFGTGDQQVIANNDQLSWL